MFDSIVQSFVLMHCPILFHTPLFKMLSYSIMSIVKSFVLLQSCVLLQCHILCSTLSSNPLSYSQPLFSIFQSFVLLIFIIFHLHHLSSLILFSSDRPLFLTHHHSVASISSLSHFCNHYSGAIRRYRRHILCHFKRYVQSVMVE